MNWVCIVSEKEHGRYLGVGLEHRCRSLRHMHYTASKVARLVKSGDMAWVGKHRRVAMYLHQLSWAKIYNRNVVGEVINCGMQLVRGLRR
jgi:hypothetical protein